MPRKVRDAELDSRTARAKAIAEVLGKKPGQGAVSALATPISSKAGRCR